MTFSIRQLLLVTALIAVGLWALSSLRNGSEAIRNSYAVMQVGDMITIHVRKSGKAPRDWCDLRSAYDITQDGYNSFTLEELEHRVHVDFAALETGQGEVLRIRNGKHGRQVTPTENEMNRRIERSLKKCGMH